MEKTNVMRILDQKKIKYNEYFYGDTNAISGVEVARVLNEDANKVFKTLVTIAKSKQNYIFMIPVDLLPLTGYVHGGCSPIGLKKPFKVVIDASAQNFNEIIFSGGKIGFQVEVELKDLKKVINYKFDDIVK